MAETGRPAKTSKWWQTILWAVAMLAITVYLYWDLTKFEIEGGTRRLWVVLAMAYKLVGKWGAVGIMGALSGLMFFLGISQLRGSLRRPDKEE